MAITRSSSRTSWHKVLHTSSSPPGFKPKAISSRTAQTIHRSSVTRASAEKPMPVARHNTSRMVGTAAMFATFSRSSANAGSGLAAKGSTLTFNSLKICAGRPRELR